MFISFVIWLDHWTGIGQSDSMPKTYRIVSYFQKQREPFCELQKSDRSDKGRYDENSLRHAGPYLFRAGAGLTDAV